MSEDIRMAERLAIVELKLEQYSLQCARERAETKSDISAMDAKLDELLGLKNKGMGAFWLASSLLGTSLIGAVSFFLSWMKG
jgi:hypothetical protein